MLKSNLKLSKIAIQLSVCAATALCTNFVGACSADEDDIYYGDELETRTKATRSVGEGGIISYDYSIDGGPMSITEYINQANDLTATITFEWDGNDVASNVQVNTEITTSNPTITISTPSGYIEVPQYEVTYKHCTSVTLDIWNYEGKSYFITDVTVEYKQVTYDMYGQKTGYGASNTYSKTVKLDVTSKVHRHIHEKK